MLLCEHFVTLVEIFRFYASATSSVHDAHQMEFLELCTGAAHCAIPFGKFSLSFEAWVSD